MMKKTSKRKESTAAPTPYRRWTAIPAALALIAVLTIGWWILIRPGQDMPELGESIPTEETKPDVVINVEKDPAMNWEEVPELYRDILTKYQTALAEKWDAAQWERNGLNKYIPQRTDDLSKLGYSLLDFNGDGNMELLISDGYHIFGIYVMADGAVVSRQQDENRIEMYLVQNNWIYTVESSDISGTYHTIWWYGQDSLGTPNLVAEEVVFTTNDGKWYAGPNEKDALPVTEHEAMMVLEKYQPQTISVTRFVEEQQESTDVLPAGYAHILEKYVKAHLEEWTPEEYMQNDISYVLKDLSIYSDYGYALMDLDGVGEKELLITDGELIFDMYIMLDDGPGHVISAGERLRYFLCADNVIGYRGSSGAANTTLEYFKLLPYGDSALEMMLQHDEDGWHKIDGAGMVTITEDEARHIQDAYAAVEIPFQPLLRAETVEDKIFVNNYGEALKELIKWNPGIENMYMGLVDISGDGNSELLLGTADSFGTVYTLRDGEVYYVISYGTDGGLTLCEDGVVMYHSPNDPYSQYTFISLKFNEAVTVDEILFHSEKQCWYRENASGPEYLTEAQLQEIIESYGSLSVTMIPVSDYLEGE